MYIERSFAHILDCGGMRRTTLRRWENLKKRKLAEAFYNFSQVMRKLFGLGRQVVGDLRPPVFCGSLVFLACIAHYETDR